MKLAESPISGVLHLGGPERLSRFELMRHAAAAIEIDQDLVRPTSLSRASLTEPRPADVSLDSTRLRTELPDLKIPLVETVMASLFH